MSNQRISIIEIRQSLADAVDAVAIRSECLSDLSALFAAIKKDHDRNTHTCRLAMLGEMLCDDWASLLEIHEKDLNKAWEAFE